MGNEIEGMGKWIHVYVGVLSETSIDIMEIQCL
jgi:hypothetical protein